MSQPEQTITPPTTVSDDTLRRFLGYHMKRAFNVVQADLVATLKPFELRMLTYTALVLICDNPGLSQAQLAAAMDVERPNIVVIVDELERRELINRTRVPTDRRAYALVPTLQGRRLCGQAVAAVETHEAKLFAGLNGDMRSEMVAILSKVRGA
ncbi:MULTISPECIES: MarR family winged helix-turn-helix transcriptional regulator [Lentibacter]|jgi:DNA-binding MarR family transcriptional regulator|uniref:DNA-binding transcriptional regulator, MarR family n=1 Tax=Lentibacter algarum TaxID=576131 RepID=A0A1H3H677_9RHOB|nr:MULTISPECIES: MarR family transcriptional regulator [Lentibacter]MCO4778431.1 MarR family transcriptional regulator [Lentibacter algarum]MCO4827986.1 MarR family transcriptional regulator [Lentibacter algarum]MDG1290052.1 MarR family transcriptional regulator [Lentibacter sp.]WIF30672.1 transcriptional regulator, MarR family [Lentibacter algarum]SDY10139.1 DNA-binding transcriptional regulator, MarR family [Lentibacter algarum]